MVTQSCSVHGRRGAAWAIWQRYMTIMGQSTSQRFLIGCCQNLEEKNPSTNSLPWGCGTICLTSSRCRGSSRYYLSAQWKKHITADHVVLFFGCQLVHAIKGLPSIDDCWNTCKALNALEQQKRACHVVHLSTCIGACILPPIGRIRMKNFGWARSPAARLSHQNLPSLNTHSISIGRMSWHLDVGWQWTKAKHPDGITAPSHKGQSQSTSAPVWPLATYKLHCQTFGVKMDDGWGPLILFSTVMTQKCVNLMSVLLDDCKGHGHCITMDSAYMGDIMAQMATTSGKSIWLRWCNQVGWEQMWRTLLTSWRLEHMSPTFGSAIGWIRCLRPGQTMPSWCHCQITKVLRFCRRQADWCKGGRMTADWGRWSRRRCHVRHKQNSTVRHSTWSIRGMEKRQNTTWPGIASHTIRCWSWCYACPTRW